MCPAIRAFDFPAAVESSKGASILRPWPGAVLAVRTDQFGSPGRQLATVFIAFHRGRRSDAGARGARLRSGSDSSRVVSSSEALAASAPKGVPCPSPVASPSGLCRAGRLRAKGSGRSPRPPFFAFANVPSENASSSFSSSRHQPSLSRPCSVQSRWRRQRVAGEGNLPSQSFQRAPLRTTRTIASTQRRAADRRIGVGKQVRDQKPSSIRELRPGPCSVTPPHTHHTHHHARVNVKACASFHAPWHAFSLPVTSP